MPDGGHPTQTALPCYPPGAMGPLELSLAVATILGGLAALWFFWDKIVVWWRAPQVQAPRSEQFVKKWVDVNYPRDSGLQATLEAAGYRADGLVALIPVLGQAS